MTDLPNDHKATTEKAQVAVPCNCPTCTAGDDQWCCRACHDLARSNA